MLSSLRARPLFLIIGSTYRSGRSANWVKVKNPKAPAVKREAELGVVECQEGSVLTLSAEK
jgi:hypothetical protein